MALGLLALLVSAATGWTMLACVCPSARARDLGLVGRAAIAFGIGLFTSSVVQLACLAGGLATRAGVVSLDLAVLTASSLLAVRIRRRRSRAVHIAELEIEAPDSLTRWGALDRALGLGLVVSLALHAGVWLVRTRNEPLGFWDAFAIWNLKARFFFLDSGEHWRRAFSDTISWSHTDYPLLLPLDVARLWTWSGHADPALPAALSALFGLLTLAILFDAVRTLRGRTMAFLALFALLATPEFGRQSAWQLADVPMSYFLVTSLALVVVGLRDDVTRARWLGVAGLAAGAAAWTKNEGLLFAFAILLALPLAGTGLARSERLRRALPFLAGLALPLVVLFAMKLGLGGENDLAADFRLESLGRLFAFARHREILASFVHTLVALAGWPLLVLLTALLSWGAFTRRSTRGGPIRPLALALLLQLSGYYLVYLMTERDLAWHLGTSNLRLFVQLWPSALLCLFLALPRPDGEREPAAPGSMNPSGSE